MADRITQFGEIRTNEDDKDSQFRNLKKAGARLRAMLGSPEAPVYPEEFTRDDRPISEGDLPEEQEVRALPEEEMAPPVRETAGIEEEAYARLRKAMNPKTPWWAGLSEGGIEGAEHLEDVADKTAQDVLKLRQTDRQLDQADKTSDWRNKYNQLIREGRLKDIIGTGAKKQRDFETKMYKSKVAVDKTEAMIRRLQKEYDLSKMYGDENTAKKLQKQLHDVKIEGYKNQLDLAKSLPKNSATLGKLTFTAMSKFTSRMKSLRNGDRVLGSLIRYHEKNPGALRKNKKWGIFSNKMTQLRAEVNKLLFIEKGDWQAVRTRYATDLTTLIKNMSGVAVSAQEYKRLEHTIPSLYSNPDAFITVWKQIMADRAEEMGDLYKIAETGQTWGNKKDKNLVFSMYDEYKGIAGKYRKYKTKGYDEKDSFHKGLKKNNKLRKGKKKFGLDV